MFLTAESADERLEAVIKREPSLDCKNCLLSRTYCQQQAAHEGQKQCPAQPFHTRIITDHNRVDAEKHEIRREPRQSVYSISPCGILRIRDEKFHDRLGADEEDADHQQREADGKIERIMQCLPGACELAAAVVVTDNRLCGLYRGVEDHEDYGEKVADDTERRHAVRTKTFHKGVISGNIHD